MARLTHLCYRQAIYVGGGCLNLFFQQLTGTVNLYCTLIFVAFGNFSQYSEAVLARVCASQTVTLLLLQNIKTWHITALNIFLLIIVCISLAMLLSA